MTTRRGPRTRGDARADILAAAAEQFAAHGYDRTSLRGVARAAGVDPALVHHYFDGKGELFAATMALPLDPAPIVAGIAEGPRGQVGERLVRTLLAVWDAPEMAGRPRALLSAQLSSDAGFGPLRGFLLTEVFGRLAEALEVDDGPRRSGLVASQMVGLILMRYVVELPGIADADPESLVGDLAPVIQGYLFA